MAFKGLPKGIPTSEFSEDFVQGMADRMAVSFHKYGRVADAFPHKLDALDSIRRRIQKYEETGNTEWLVDAANFAMIEFMHPSVSGAHFRATDSKEAPPRKTWDGTLTTRANDEIDGVL